MGKEYTAKGIADLLNVSKSTVARAIKVTGAMPERIGKQKHYYSEETAIEIMKHIEPGCDILSLIGETQPENNSEPEQLQEETVSIETFNKTMDLLKSQIEFYQNQIIVKDKQIEDYAKRLEEANELLKGLQYISAAEKTKALMETDEEPEADTAEEPPKQAQDEAERTETAPGTQKRGFSLFSIFKRK